MLYLFLDCQARLGTERQRLQLLLAYCSIPCQLLHLHHYHRSQHYLRYHCRHLLRTQRFKGSLVNSGLTFRKLLKMRQRSIFFVGWGWVQSKYFDERLSFRLMPLIFTCIKHQNEKEFEKEREMWLLDGAQFQCEKCCLSVAKRKFFQLK